MSAVELGVAVWATDRGVGIADLAPAVEQAGLESLFLTEHTHVPVSRGDVIQDEFHDQDPRILDQFTALGAAAAVTSRLKLGTGVCIAAQHDPIILAKQVATIDHLSGGRFLFGVGAGWLVEEMRNHGVRPELRWELMREQILAMKQIWTQDEAEFHGEYVNFDPLWLWPKPVQNPYPPVLVGGSGPRSLRGAAEYGDGWAPIIGDQAEFRAQRALLQRLCAEAGRDALDVTAFLFELDEQLLACCAELGVTRCAVVAPTRDLTALQSFLDRYLAVAERVCR
jgi:probable F420-dependent oxidoreductase